MKYRILSSIFILFTFCCFSQNSTKIIDSLKQVISFNPKDSVKIKAYSDLCWYYRNISTDSALSYGNRALSLSKKIQNKQGEAQAYNDLGILYYGSAEYPKALSLYQKGLNIRTELNDTLGAAALYNKIGLIYQNTFKLDSAMFYATKALKIYEDKNNIRYSLALKNNIANIHKGLKQYKKALNTHLEIAKINDSLSDYLPLTRSYNNIANAYLFLNDTINSIKYYKKSIAIAEKNNYKKELAAVYNNFGALLQSKKDYVGATKYISQSLVFRKELNDNYGIASATLHLAGLHLDLKDLNSAKEHLYSGLYLSQKINVNELKIDVFDKLATYYALKKNADSVIHYKELFKSLKDSIFSTQVLKEVAEVQEKYNAAKREKEILSQRADLAEKELNLNRKNTQLLGLIILAVVISVLGYLFYKQQKLKNHQLKKEGQLKEALVKIETQNKLQEQRLRISRDLHDNIGSQLTFIISSIENLQYGFKIKNEKLTKKLIGISGFTKETIYELRDTIWAMNKNTITLEDLETRISNFIDKADVSSTGLNFKFNKDESLSKELEFSSVTGMSIYRIIQESINNSIKHGESSKINVDFKKLDNKIEFNITDDGKGFNENEVTLSNGINNMRKRAKEIGAFLNIESEPGIGTRIVINLPFQA
ncbi:sensor histidine kinase [Algibacter aquimarinus]|uniref:histidine kinase n=1 Tax=Algibacter aquimarinus TaxID=1136748 RepID=A0ABP9H5A4_9FLAO